MEVRTVDPRDIGVDRDADTYRVYFWSPDSGRCDEYELVRPRDVHEVIQWAADNAGGRVPEIFVRHDHPPEHGLIRIAGRRPAVD